MNQIIYKNNFIIHHQLIDCRFVCSFVQKMKGTHLLSVFSCFASLFLETFSLSSNAFVQFVPFMSTRECTVPGGVWFGSFQTRLSVFIFSFIHPFIIHTPSQALQVLGCTSINLIFFFFWSSHCLDWKCLSPLHSGRFFWDLIIRFFQLLPGTIWVLN